MAKKERFNISLSGNINTNTGVGVAKRAGVSMRKFQKAVEHQSGPSYKGHKSGAILDARAGANLAEGLGSYTHKGDLRKRAKTAKGREGMVDYRATVATQYGKHKEGAGKSNPYKKSKKKK
jgi:hypothetical protein